MNIVFVPVSGPRGVGEYMRSLILANALSVHAPHVRITFILSRQAPYISECPYTVCLVDASPTQCTSQVNAIVKTLLPDVIVFDASGRAAQYRCAKKMGAKVIFISQHKKKRARAFALNRIQHIDAHCVTQLPFIDGDLNLWQKVILKIFNKPQPYFIGPVFSPADHSVFSLYSLPKHYVFFSAGGGGHSYLDGSGYLRLAADELLLAAQLWHQKTGEHCVVVLGPNYPNAAQSLKGITVIKALPNAMLMAVLQNARCAVLGGGAMLVQAIALGTSSIAIAFAKDQPARISAIKKRGLISASQLDVASIVKALEYGAPSVHFECANGCELFLNVLEVLIGGPKIITTQ